MTKQDLFDLAYSGVVKQGKPAMDSTGNCKYLTDDGRKCSIGHCIPDEKYNPNFETEDYEELLDVMLDVGIPEEHYTFCKEMQFIHDVLSHAPGEAFIPQFKGHMARLADQYELTVGE